MNDLPTDAPSRDNLVTRLKTVSIIADGLHPTRSTYSVFTSATSEVGELAEEIAIANGDSYKDPSVDGVIGEAIDVIITLLDLIHVYDPTFTEEDLNNYATKKAKKWITKLSERAASK
jgi:NTP pyrophosphatase (non-canonical NTP hydrolase)